MFLVVPADPEGDEGGVGVRDIVQLPGDLPAHSRLVVQAQTVHTPGSCHKGPGMNICQFDKKNS